MHPILIRFGSFEIGTYGLLLALGFLAALWLAKRLARKDGLPPDSIVDLSLTLLIAGILGAKLLMVAVGLFRGEPASQVFSLSTLRAGGAVHGGILAATAAFFWRIRKLGLPFGKTIDTIATAVPLGQAIGRLGCIAAGCCYGERCAEGLPWAIVFDNPEAVRFIPDTHFGHPLHPVQIYFGLSNLVILAALLVFLRRRKFPGQVAALYFMLEGVFRAVLETWRGDVERGVWFGLDWLSTGRITAAVMVLVGVSIWAWGANRHARL